MSASNFHLFVLLNDYPYFNGEPFFHRELPYLASTFENVILFNQRASIPPDAPFFDTLPTNVRVVEIGTELSAKSKLFGMLKILSIYGIDVFKDLINSGLLFNRLAIKTALMYKIKAHYLKQRIRTFIKSEGILASEGVWYSYWADESALVLAELKKSGEVTRAVSRAHNTDIYEERHPHSYLPFRRFVFQHIDVVVAISEHGKNYLSTRYSGLNTSFEISRLGIPEAPPINIQLGFPLRLLTLSTVVPVKNLECVVDALSGWEGGDIEWHHIGEGRGDSYEKALTARIYATFVGHPKVSVTLHGMVAPTNVMATVRGIKPHVLVNSSIFEGIPVSMMELASLGVPIIGPRICGVPEIVDEGKNGFLFQPENPQNLVDTLNRFVSLSQDEYRTYCEASFLTQRTKYHEARNFPGFSELLLNFKDR